MRILLPTDAERATIVARLGLYFDTERVADFNLAFRQLAKFYRVKPPRVHLRERLDDPKVSGYCSDRGVIELYLPAVWKRNRKHNSKREWTEVALHEFGHYLLWADAEPKADLFAAKMLKGAA